MRWRECQNYPADHKVEEENRVHHKRLSVGWLAVGEESRGGEGGPAKGRCHHHQAHSEADGPRATDQDNPAHSHRHRQRQNAVAQHAQALEEGDGAAQQLGVEGDDDGAKPDDNKDLFKKKNHGHSVNKIMCSVTHDTDICSYCGHK